VTCLQQFSGIDAPDHTGTDDEDSHYSVRYGDEVVVDEVPATVVVVLDDVEFGTVVVVVGFGSVVVVVLTSVFGVVVEVVVGTAMAGVVDVVVGATLGARVVGVGTISPFGPT
jgi:hypothetical protein